MRRHARKIGTIIVAIILIMSFIFLRGAPNNNEIVIGTSLDLSKTLKAESESTKLGLNLAFEEANREGGINGKKLKLVVLDDEYDPDKAKKNVEALVNKHGTDIILSSMGAVPLFGFIDMIKDKKILAIFPSTGDPTLRNSQLEDILHFRLDYRIIHLQLINYLVETGSKKFAIFYPNDQSAAGTEDHLDASGLKKDQYILVSYDSNSAEFKAQAKKILDFGPDTILFFSSSRAATELLRQIGVQELVKMRLVGVELKDDLFEIFLKDQGLKFIDTQNLPNPKTSTLEIVQDYRKAMGSKPVDIFSMEAYITASVFIDLLKRIKGPITKESIIEAAENTKDYTFKGLPLNFNPATRGLYNFLWLDTGEKDWKPLEAKKLENGKKVEEKKSEAVSVPLEQKPALQQVTAKEQKPALQQVTAKEQKQAAPEQVQQVVPANEQKVSVAQTASAGSEQKPAEQLPQSIEQKSVFYEGRR